MTKPKPQGTWSDQYVHAIGARIAALRGERGLSARELADRTEEFGHRIEQTILANLETGRRATVSVPEIFVLAAALDVPPMSLLLPGGDPFDGIEVLPDLEVMHTEAARWVAGSGAHVAESAHKRLIGSSDDAIDEVRMRYDRAVRPLMNAGNMDLFTARLTEILEDYRQVLKSKDDNTAGAYGRMVNSQMETLIALCKAEPKARRLLRERFDPDEYRDVISAASLATLKELRGE